MAPAGNPRPYKDFFMPTLHRRFADASFYSFLLCYSISVCMGEWKGWWQPWFPIGLAGARASLIFISALLIYVLRISQWHIGQRNTQSPLDTFQYHILSKKTIGTIGIYALSAWFYSEVYIWGRAGRVRLEFTDPGLPHERIRLNERPIYFRFLFVALAVVQGAMHLYFDYDQVEIPVVKGQGEKKDPRAELLKSMTSLLSTAGKVSAATFLAGSTVYFLGLRHFIWYRYYNFASHFISLAKTSKPTGLPPFVNLVTMFAFQATFLVLLWNFVNTTFNLYMAQEPLKKDRPITADSKDPNGSLLIGLKSKKHDSKVYPAGILNEVESELNYPQYTAFWELALITERFPDRRKTIYGELERKKAPTHKQITDICLAELRAIVERINTATDPDYNPNEDGKKKSPQPIELVPQIAQPLNDKSVTGPGEAPVTRLQKLGNVTGEIARTRSSPQNAQNAIAAKYLRKGQDKVDEGVKEAKTALDIYKERFARSPVGWFLRSSLRRTASVVVNGSPYSKQHLILCAITTLTNLTVSSLKEDEYGQFQGMVPEIIRAFTQAIKTVEAYMKDLAIHWTDVETLAQPEADRKKVEEVDVVLTASKEGLAKILGAFNEYLEALGMNRTDIQDAKKCVARETPETVQVR